MYNNIHVVYVSEAEFVLACEKPVVPIMLQRRYKPNGWLGHMTNGLAPVAFNGKQTFEHSYDQLLKEIRERIAAIEPPG